MVFAVGNIQTTHYQATTGEFAYTYLRLQKALTDHDYLITHAQDDSFCLLLPPRPLPLSLPTMKHAEPVPVRVKVWHGLGLLPVQMTEQGFRVFAKEVLNDSSSEIGGRCPRRTSCLCSFEKRGLLGACRNIEFLIEGQLAPNPP